MMTTPLLGSPPVSLRADRLSTPIGDLLIVCTADALCVVDFADCIERMERLLTPRFGSYALSPAHDPLGVTARLARYFDGDPAALDSIVVDTGGTAYQRRVWTQLRLIPHGRTRSYGELARELGGTHARAVGHANSLNPLAIVVPCHRVIGANTTLVGYAGGLRRKRWLLDHEARHAALPLPF